MFLTEDGSVKVGDFGASKQLDAQAVALTGIGTPCWMAPEVIIHNEAYDCKVDIWSLGIMVIELMEGWAPFSDLSPYQAMTNIVDDSEPATLATETAASLACRDFLSVALVKEPTKRWSAAHLLEHEWLSDAQQAPLAELLAEQAVALEQAGGGVGGDRDDDSTVLL